MSELKIKCKLEALKAKSMAICAQIEGAKAQNTERLSQGYALAYVDEHFRETSHDLIQLAIEMEELEAKL